jgi:hypothetical protein
MDKEQSYQCLKSGDTEGETEISIMAAQDQALSANYYKKRILKEVESKCQLCKEYKETIGHITSE